ncbi:hypothetical protein [Blastomonas sp. RAC04]|uniref:hypothetical protein n=1 Tax=Blastomonas sp. RAC04 TaxID=1842535 RepID=UPI00083D9704|nr:hypothetical protein [Blastomonas sp. RAC04]
MTTRRATFKQADCTRALRAAVAAGLPVSGFKIDAYGEIHVFCADGQPQTGDNSFDRIMRK